MYNDITVPYNSVMLFNTIKLKPGVDIEDVQMAVGEMCNVVKNTYKGDGGFIAGQVVSFSGFVSEEGSLNQTDSVDDHYAIVTYWESFDKHEKSHLDAVFNEKFEGVLEYVSEAEELGYTIEWQGD